MWRISLHGALWHATSGSPQHSISTLHIDTLGFIDPNITVNIVKNSEIIEKRKLRLPEVVVNFAKCKNPRCITSIEKDLDQVFTLTDRENKVYRCKYCEMSLKNDK